MTPDHDVLVAEVAKWKALSRMHENKRHKLQRALDQARAQLDAADTEISHLRVRTTYDQQLLRVLQRNHERTATDG